MDKALGAVQPVGAAPNMEESTPDCIRYFCGCERSVPDKMVAWCAAHAGRCHAYTELLRDKRRIKEAIRLAQGNVEHLRRRLYQRRRTKAAFWATLQEFPQRAQDAEFQPTTGP